MEKPASSRKYPILYGIGKRASFSPQVPSLQPALHVFLCGSAMPTFTKLEKGKEVGQTVGQKGKGRDWRGSDLEFRYSFDAHIWFVLTSIATLRGNARDASHKEGEGGERLSDERKVMQGMEPCKYLFQLIPVNNFDKGFAFRQINIETAIFHFRAKRFNPLNFQIRADERLFDVRDNIQNGNKSSQREDRGGSGRRVRFDFDIDNNSFPRENSRKMLLGEIGGLNGGKRNFH